jgi:ABC-type Fe3+/spermidine/putrescine transport system ATPase subunit
MGNPTELYERPINKFVSDFIGTSNFIPAAIVDFDAGSRRATVRTGRGLKLAGVVTSADATPAAGDDVIVAVRPERLEVVPATSGGEARTGWTSVAGRVHQGTYLGDQTEYRIATDEVGELVARRQNAAGAVGALGAGPGDPVTVRWHEEANLILVD